MWWAGVTASNDTLDVLDTGLLRELGAGPWIHTPAVLTTTADAQSGWRAGAGQLLDLPTAATPFTLAAHAPDGHPPRGPRHQSHHLTRMITSAAAHDARGSTHTAGVCK